MAEQQVIDSGPERKPGTLGVIWRAAAFVLLGIAITALGSAALAGSSASHVKISIDFESVPGVLLEVVSVTLATFLMLLTEKRIGWSALYLDKSAVSIRKIGFGLLIGAVGIGIPSALLLVSRELDMKPTPAGSWINAAAFDVAFFALAAAMEELVVRGYLFSLFRRQWGWTSAAAGTSILFGALHLLNPGASFESLLNVTLAGFFLVGVLFVTKSLYAAIAAHFAWNWTMAAIFHSAVSGASIPAPNYATVDNGPDWLTGGPWGPEGGAVATVAMFILIFYLYKKRPGRAES